MRLWQWDHTTDSGKHISCQLEASLPLLARAPAPTAGRRGEAHCLGKGGTRRAIARNLSWDHWEETIHPRCGEREKVRREHETFQLDQRVVGIGQ